MICWISWTQHVSSSSWLYSHGLQGLWLLNVKKKLVQYHISAENITHNQLNSICLDTLANVFQKEAPNVWNLLGVLFDVESGVKLLCSQCANVHQAGRADASTRHEELLNVVCYCTLAVLVLLLTLISER